VTKVRQLLFDLDGTIADTAPDLALALNLLRAEHGQPALDFARIRPLVSAGAAAMVCDAFSITEQVPQFHPLRERFLALYSENICCHSRLFPGMDQVLDYLDDNRIRWGIVTNKPGWLTEPLLHAMALHTRSGCIVSGDTLPRRKPHPEPLLHACQLMACRPEETAYIGDARTDIQAGASAGMATGVALYGYLEPGTQADEWGADTLFQQPLDILSWLTDTD
jgi:N-acetyl-D-muramate 6-phosphate phosphatase